MRAASVPRYGPPEIVTIEEFPRPVPRSGEVLVRVEAAAVTSGDARMRAGRFPRGFGVPARLALGVRGPRARVLGSALSGIVEQVPDGETLFSVGDAVAGMTGMRLRAHAEFARVPISSLAAIPPGVSNEDAAAILFGGTTALHFLRDRARVRSGDRVLVNGASGAVGTAAAHFGASVTAVASARNHDLVTRLGAVRTIDYAQAPVTDIEDRFDVVFDAVGNISRAEGLRLLASEGALVLAVASLSDTVRARGRVFAGSAPERAEDVAFLLDLVEREIVDPVTRVAGGLTVIREAHQVVDSGRKVGNLVILPRERGRSLHFDEPKRLAEEARYEPSRHRCSTASRMSASPASNSSA